MITRLCLRCYLPTEYPKTHARTFHAGKRTRFKVLKGIAYDGTLRYARKPKRGARESRESVSSMWKEGE